MKKKTIRILASVTAVVISLILISSVMAAPDTTPKTAQNLAVLQQQNIILKKPNVQPSMSESDAIAIASKYVPGLASTATSIVAEYQLMTNNGDKLLPDAALQNNPQLKKDGFLNDTPVYIVSFEGITKLGHDGINGKQPTVFHEGNVIVDVTSGAVIASFFYR